MLLALKQGKQFMTDDNYRQEVQQAFERDAENEGLIGLVWKLSAKGKNPSQIGEKLGTPTCGWVYSYKRNIRAIEFGELPSAPSSALQCGRALRGFSRKHKDFLSDSTHSRLQTFAAECDRIAGDPEKRSLEEEKLQDKTARSGKPKIAGAYVYSMQHYLDHPVEPSDENPETDDRTYFKVGQARDVYKRFAQQSSKARIALPEPLVLLRIYGFERQEAVERLAARLNEIEKKIHDHLMAADHPRNRQKKSGTEWFVTHLKFLDSTARLLDLRIIDPREDINED